MRSRSRSRPLLPACPCVPPSFDRTISVDTPDIKGRDQIFRVHLGKLKLEKPLEFYSGECELLSRTLHFKLV